MEENKNQIIWSSFDTMSYEERKQDLIDSFGELDEEELQSMIDSHLESRLDDTRRELRNYPSYKILKFGTMGLWNGPCRGYTVMNVKNYADIFYSDMDDITWYINAKTGNLEADAYHHDGKNHYIYREYKFDLNDDEENELHNLIMKGNYTEEDLDKYTTNVGREISKILWL